MHSMQRNATQRACAGSSRPHMVKIWGELIHVAPFYLNVNELIFSYASEVCEALLWCEDKSICIPKSIIICNGASEGARERWDWRR